MTYAGVKISGTERSELVQGIGNLTGTIKRGRQLASALELPTDELDQLEAQRKELATALNGGEGSTALEADTLYAARVATRPPRLLPVTFEGADADEAYDEAEE